VASTTYLDEAERAARVLVLDAGRVLLSGAPTDIVAGLGGVIRVGARRPEAEFAWRRAGAWRSWHPGGDGGIQPDLQDAVVLAELRREAAARPPAPRDGTHEEARHE
jgi:ABC-2 type transport system ATP-binding protein